MRTPLIVASGVLVSICLVCAIGGLLLAALRRASPPPEWAGAAHVRARFACASPHAETDAAIVARRGDALGLDHEVRAIDPTHLEITLRGVRGPEIASILTRPSRLALTEVLDGAVQVDLASLPPGVTPSATPAGPMGWHASEPGLLEAFRSGAPPGASFAIACTTFDGIQDCEAMYLREPAAMGNAHVESASVSMDEMSGAARVDLVFTREGGQRFAELTRGLVRRRLAIVLDGRVLSAPLVIEEIDGGRVAITMGGDGSLEAQYVEAQTLAVALDLGEPPRCDWALESVENASP